MRSPSRWILLLILALAALVAGPAWQRVQARRYQATLTAQAQAALPMRVLWVWERPEDLSPLWEPGIGVAVLEQTIRLGASVSTTPRRQPILLPRGIARIAVVRIEAEAGFLGERQDSAMVHAAEAMLLRTAREPGIAALQIDFDARRSERGFYRRLLLALRPEMPPGLPLDITALASWCSTDDWLAGLPIDEAVPMFFRMEPDRRRLLLTSPEYRVREPLCAGTVGVSTGEPWPRDLAGKRVYLFADRGWRQDLPLLAAAGLARETHR